MSPRFKSSFRMAILGATFSGLVLLAQPATEALSIRRGSTEATVFAGVSGANNSEKEGTRLRIETKMPFGGRVAYNFDEHSAVEFSMANPFSISANYLYHFYPMWGRLVPYVTAGAGGSRYGLELNEGSVTTKNKNGSLNEGGPVRRQTGLTGNFGGGIKYLLSDRFALRFDVRDVVGRYSATFTNVPGSTGGRIKAGRTLNDFQFTVGFVLRFGGG